MWRHARWLAFPAFLAAVLFLAPEDSWGQPPGGGFGRGGFGGKGGSKGGGGMDPDMIWNFMSQGKDSINLNDPQHARTKQRMMERGQAIPPNGILTKDQFRTNYQQQLTQGGGPGGRFGGGGPGSAPGGGSVRFGVGGPGGPTPGSPTVMTFTAGPDGKPVMVSGGSGPDGKPVMMVPPGALTPGGMPGAAPNADMFAGIFQRADRNGDGRVTPDEASDRIRQNWAQYDRNGDGGLDLNEYTAYMQERFAGGREGREGRGFGGPGGPGGFDPNNPQGFAQQGGWNGQPGWNGQQGPWGPQGGPGGPWGGGERAIRDRSDEEIQKPVVYRYGKLPKELPSWFETLDTDKDGMVGLYEWRRDNRKIEDFVPMDLNNDQYLTADEWLRYNRMILDKKAETFDEDGRPVRSSTTERSGPARGPGDGERSGPGRGGPGNGNERNAGRPERGGPGGNDKGPRPERGSGPGGNERKGGNDRKGGNEPRRPNPFTGR